jgi:initiation factor 1A
MGKNVHGGAGHKKFGRKHNTQSSGGSSNTFVRTSSDPNEIYAIATKMLGNNMFHCHCIDNKVRLCHIRGRFAGRNKRDNVINAGTWILIGLRDWDSCGKKLQQCDLLEIYSESTKERLKDLDDRDWSVLHANDLSKVKTDSGAGAGATDANDEFKFMTDRDEEIMRLTQEMKSSATKKITITETTDDYEEINVDDI